MENVIEVRNLTKDYKERRAVDRLSFDVKEGEILGLLGPNGSGKSTTINCILSLLKYNEGTIKIFGSEMKPDAYDIKAEIGVVFQDVAVFEELTVYENIDYFCGLYIKNKKQRKNYVNEAIELTGLNGFEKYRPKALSGGLLRRLNIACGIAHKPKLMFLDEPTVAVDPQSRNRILDNIKSLREGGTTVVYTTHYMEEVEILCDRIIILDNGKIIASGTADELKALTGVGERVTVETEPPHGDSEHFRALTQEIRALENVADVKCDGGIITVSYKKSGSSAADLALLIDFLAAKHVAYSKIYSERPTLNDVFLELTGKELRD